MSVRTARRLAAALLAFVLAVVAAPVFAHLMPNSVISLDFGREAVNVEILMPVSELSYGSGHRLALTPATGATPEAAYLRAYVLRHLSAVSPDGRAWAASVTGFSIAADSWNTDIKAMVRITPPAGASARRLVLRWDGIIDRVANHFVLVFVRSDFATGTLASTPAMIGGLQGTTRTLAIDRGVGSPWRGFAASLRLGMEHIAEGHDHLLFLIALILPAPLLAFGGRWGAFGGWRHTVRRLTYVVTAFTVGHSITLIGGAFVGWQLPSRPVEVGIAVSILVSAVHAWRPLFAGREALLAGLFGLVHGLAFATVIGNFRLEPIAKAQSILGFNLGIELVQLAVVACVLPSLLLLAQTRAYPVIRQAGALFAGVAALAWIEERVTSTPNGIGDAIDAALGYAPWAVPVATLLAVAFHLAARRGRPMAPSFRG